MSCVTMPLPHSAMCPLMYLEKLILLPLTSLNRFKSRWALAFLTAWWAVLLYSSQVICYLSLLPPSVCFLLVSWVSPGATCSSMQASWNFCLTSCSWGWTVLGLRGGDPWLPSALFDPSYLQSPIPWDSFKQIPKEIKVCSPMFISLNII